MSKFDCALCGRDITDDGASFSSYLDGVKESRCPECGGAQGVDIEGLRAENAALRAEVAALREACTLAAMAPDDPLLEPQAPSPRKRLEDYRLRETEKGLTLVSDDADAQEKP